MAVFIVSYDLRKPDFNYQPLYDALDEIGAKHVQDSIWGVDTSSSAASVFDYLWQYLHNERDRLFVITFDKKADYKSHKAITLLKNL
jgi:hypothetical protein